MKVLVIGAGMSGLLTGIRLKQAGIDFTIIEKNADVGGTWLENTYPGCRVDNPNHMYSYSFEPNHDWPQHFSHPAGAAGLLPRRGRQVRPAPPHPLRDRGRGGGVRRGARALAGRRSRPRTASGETLEANAVITAVGQLNQPRLPDIAGRRQLRRARPSTPPAGATTST